MEAMVLEYLAANIGENAINPDAIEKIYEHDFCGNVGYRQIEVNAYGTEIRETQTHLGTIGKDVKLTNAISPDANAIDPDANAIDPDANAIKKEIQ